MREMKDSGVPWIGEIPKGWSTSKLKYHVRQRTEKSDTKEGYIALDNIESWSGRYLPTGFFPEGDTLFVRTGDILFGKLRPYLAKVFIAVDDGCCSSEFVVLTSLDVNRLYLRYLLVNHMFIDEVNMSTYGTKMPRANASFILNSIIPIPSVTEQSHIANFLDSKCVEIDSILEQTKASIEEYKKLKQSVITEAVTKGIRGKRPMKDSGVEWIGEIPEEWVVNRLKFLFELHRGYDLANELFIDGGIPVYGSGGFMGYHNEIKAKGPNILIGRSGSTGKLHFVDSDFWPHNTGIYVCDFKGNDEKYIYYLLSALDMNALSTQTAVPTLDRKKIQESLFVFTFDRTEQQEIAAYLDEKCATIDSLIASKEALITELETYKKSLIYEYVTGKMIVAE